MVQSRKDFMLNSLYSFLVAVVLCNALCQAPAQAQTQSGKGGIAGNAKDEANSWLPSALIEVQRLARKTVSDDQGQFRIADVSPGDYTLTVSYVGFDPFSTTVKV